jgi:hypothetical protein
METIAFEEREKTLTNVVMQIIEDLKESPVSHIGMPDHETALETLRTIQRFPKTFNKIYESLTQEKNSNYALSLNKSNHGWEIVYKPC